MIVRNLESRWCRKRELQDYSEFLHTQQIAYRVRDPWLIVGDGSRRHGWKLHISSIQADAAALLTRILPCLRATGEHFKIARSAGVLAALNSGELGETQIGKFVSIYPRNDQYARALAQGLIALTEGLRGPAVPSDRHVGTVVYARYGSFDPVIVRDRLGNEVHCIYGPNGELRPDRYYLPFVSEEGIENPFADFARPPIELKNSLFGPGYRTIGVVRGKTTGSIFVALDLRSQEHVSLKILKQALPYVYSDEYGRDLRDRLRHQAMVHRALAHLPWIPQADDYFEVDGTGYLPINYLEGETAESIAVRTVAGRPWASLDGELQRRIWDIAYQFLSAVQDMHEAGYVHRDLAASNVWVSTEGRVYLLDLELAHHVADFRPPFAMGTAGFMSPQQEHVVRPSFADDVYSAACVLILLLTGLDPRRIVFEGGRLLTARLGAYMAVPHGQSTVLQTLGACTEQKPDCRPSLRELILSMDRGKLATGVRQQGTLQPRIIQNALESGLRGLVKGAHHVDSGLWLSPTLTQDRHGWLQRSNFEVRRDANRGVAGVVYTLARLARSGIRVEADVITRVMPWLLDTSNVDLPGLHFGSAGIAVAVAEAVAGGIVEMSADVSQFINRALEGRLDWFDITHGAAGQGIAAMYCGDILGNLSLCRLSSRCAGYLLSSQNQNGSWTTPEGAAGISGETLTGFAHGVAGIVYFLAAYSARTKNTDSLRAAERGAYWLRSQAERANSTITWRYSDRNETRWHWWCHGGPGIALTFLILFELTGESAFAEVARTALHVHPADLRHPNLTVCHGLAGLGEIYLEAARALAEEEWLYRAGRLANLIIALGRVNSDGSLTWIVEDPQMPTADLMVGSGGVLHFLMRVYNRGQIAGFPLLLEWS